MLLSSTEHLRNAANLDTVLPQVHEHQFFCNMGKCQPAMQEIKWMGIVLTADTVKPDLHKGSSQSRRCQGQAVSRYPTIYQQHLILSWLKPSLAGYVRRFFPKFPTLAASLLEHVSSKEKVPWTVQCEQSFHDIKHALINATALHHPDLSKPFQMYTDPSDYAFGGVLMQKPENELKPFAWTDRNMSNCKAKVNYYALEKELVAITFSSRQ